MRCLGRYDSSRQMIHPTPAYTSPNLWPEVLIDLTRGSSKFLSLISIPGQGTLHKRILPSWPTSMCVGKRRNETTGGGIDVNGDIDASLSLIFIQNIRDLRYWLVMTLQKVSCLETFPGVWFPHSIRASQNDEHSNSIFVNVLLYELGI